MSILGPFWVGLIYDSVMPSLPYWMGALVFIIAVITMSRLKQPARLSKTEAEMSWS